jgi:hypothetical protein
VVLLISNIDYRTKHFHYLRNIWFNAANFTHDAVSESLEVAPLQWLCHKVSNHIFCRTPLNTNLLHVCSIRDEEVPDVDVSRSVPT